jgi:hypothetical protein
VNPLDGIVPAGTPLRAGNTTSRAALCFLTDAQVAAEICGVGLDGDIRQKRTGLRLCAIGSID